MHAWLTATLVYNAFLIACALSVIPFPTIKRKPPSIPDHMKDYYREYMQSPEWKRKRQERIKIDGGKCAKCFFPNKKRLQVHHKTYKRLGNENVRTDLITLCEKHHKREHKK